MILILSVGDPFSRTTAPSYDPSLCSHSCYHLCLDSSSNRLLQDKPLQMPLLKYQRPRVYILFQAISQTLWISPQAASLQECLLFGAGHYSCRVGNGLCAIQHFRAAAESSDGREGIQALAAAELVTSLLEQGGVDALSQATAVLAQYGLGDHTDKQLLAT